MLLSRKILNRDGLPQMATPLSSIIRGSGDIKSSMNWVNFTTPSILPETTSSCLKIQIPHVYGYLHHFLYNASDGMGGGFDFHIGTKEDFVIPSIDLLSSLLDVGLGYGVYVDVNRFFVNTDIEESKFLYFYIKNLSSTDAFTLSMSVLIYSPVDVGSSIVNPIPPPQG